MKILAANRAIFRKQEYFSSSPDCSGILLQNEVEQKIQRKAGYQIKKEATLRLLLNFYF